jgi:hypothetical protein
MTTFVKLVTIPVKLVMDQLHATVSIVKLHSSSSMMKLTDAENVLIHVHKDIMNMSHLELVFHVPSKTVLPVLPITPV